jgi:(1->4)-alpha-D-glucan 1-alpha-D-glucosylmutase
VPDTYQGDELPFRALVDPDNRRPVDFAWHQAMLRRLMGGSPPVPETLKMFVTMRLLGLRVRRYDVFAGGLYEPLDAGAEACAFVRGGDVLVVVPVREGEPAGTLETPRGRWRDVFRGEEHTLTGRQEPARLLRGRAAAVFERV